MTGQLQKRGFFHFFPRWSLFLAWGIAIAWLSLTPKPPEIELGFFGWDKFQHAAAYGVLTTLACRAYGCFSCGIKLCWLRAMATTVIFGGLIEVAQGLFTETRAAEFSDLLADLIGALCAYAIGMAVTSGRGDK